MSKKQKQSTKRADQWSDKELAEMMRDEMLRALICKVARINTHLMPLHMHLELVREVRR